MQFFLTPQPLFCRLAASPCAPFCQLHPPTHAPTPLTALRPPHPPLTPPLLCIIRGACPCSPAVLACPLWCQPLRFERPRSGKQAASQPAAGAACHLNCHATPPTNRPTRPVSATRPAHCNRTDSTHLRSPFPAQLPSSHCLEAQPLTYCMPRAQPSPLRTDAPHLNQTPPPPLVLPHSFATPTHACPRPLSHLRSTMHMQAHTHAPSFAAHPNHYPTPTCYSFHPLLLLLCKPGNGRYRTCLLCSLQHCSV